MYQKSHLVNVLNSPATRVRLYSVLVLPKYEVVAHGLSSREATAWVQTYNDAVQGNPTHAILAEEAEPGMIQPAA
jgi:hypothetical protein